MIDLRSDTVTKPTAEMRQAMYDAEVGDDVYGEDPTVNRLEELAAALLGKEAALFVTSGTQGNQLAVLSQTAPGDEIILESDSHIFYYEGGAVSALAGVQTRTVQGNKGSISEELLQKAIRGNDIHFPDTSLVCYENTHNRAGGAAVPLENMKRIYKTAADAGIKVHLDGARLFNAAAALNCSIDELASWCDTVSVCLSKGLGSPAGSILAGSAEVITKARKWRKRLGGGMRQAGILAAPGILSLTKMTERLRTDHENAQFLAQGLRQIKGLKVINSVDTNIVLIDISAWETTNEAFIADLKSEGLLAVGFGENIIRFTTHYDVNRGDIEKAIAAVNKIKKIQMA
ncbi:low-specificity L-threonine aldolase [Fictibacillus aquaticus]|uniref:Low-specificity L-threonine aldolase n=1 Tax=Fictibacillus aquaticus TaxID=2021314 RepID=A0A235FBH3_9BACL|nr:low-specificity L-threonine aldolase [Fictibacillus aquaticus]OYD58676.1 low-specificity L-threonine aldolase [Fictibacillus aquaticus]